jgi:transposase
VPTKYYSQQFKDEACKLATSPDYGPARAAQQLGVHYTTLRSWMRKRNLLSQSRPVTLNDLPQTDDPKLLQAQLKEAHKRIQQLEIEREILKKAAAFFAKENP